jgi:hypothetical protein
MTRAITLALMLLPVTASAGTVGHSPWCLVPPSGETLFCDYVAYSSSAVAKTEAAGLSARYLGSIERATVSASVSVLGRYALRIDPCELIKAPQRR